MSDTYKVPDHLFNQLVKVALSKPDPMYMDAMGQHPAEKVAAWTMNLAAVVDMIAVHAWANGWQQCLEAVKEMGHGEQAQNSGD